MPSHMLLEREALDVVEPAPVESAARRALEGGRRLPHICFVAPSTWPVLSRATDIPVVGGAEVQQSVIAPALARRGYRVSMICLDYGQQDRTVVDGVTVHKIHRPDEGIPVLRFLHPRLTSMWSALRRIDADIYYQRSSAIATGVMAAFCKRHGKHAIYAGASDVDFSRGKQEIALARDKAIFEYGVRNVSRVFVQNEAQRESLRANFGRESVYIPNCYAPPPGSRADPNGYVVWVATMRPTKRPDVLLEIARRSPGVKFVVIGGSDGKSGIDAVRNFREAAAGLPNVEYRGFVPFAEADRAFDGARVLLNTSAYEGFPNTFLQAWSRGVPTVSFVDTGSRHEGAPVYDIVGDVEDATARLDRLMRDDAHWTQASQRVLAHFTRNHSVEAVVSRYEREFLDLVGTR